MVEQVLVFEEAEMQWFKDLPGFSMNEEDVQRFAHDIISRSGFMDRGKAEKDPTHKQVVAYTLVINEETEKILAYKRTKKGGEGRLHEKWSVGVGGHINPIDRDPKDQAVYLNAMERELREEIGIVDQPGHVIGLLYDPSNDVGKVHFGIVAAILVKTEDVKSTEDAIGDDLKWVTGEEALKLPNLENWSKLVVEGLING